MIQKFFKSTIISNYIKYVLKENPLPIYKIIKKNEYMVKDCTYTYKDKILRCTKEGIFKPLQNDNPASYNIIDTYLPKSYNPKYTYQFNSSINYYDSNTHRYLGEYLRQLDNIYNINLMPLYNCFNFYEVNNIGLYPASKNGLGIEKPKGTKIFLVPIKFDKTYTIAIDSNLPVLFKPIFYKKEPLNDLLGRDITGCLKNNTLIKKGSCSFKNPFLYSVGHEDISNNSFLSISQLYEYERYLYLAIQLPENNTSSISILEGDYLNNEAEDIFNLDIKYTFEKDPFNSNYLYTNLSLLCINDGQINPFSNKLVEYLLSNTIDEREIWVDNIRRIQNKINYNPKYKGFWSNTLRYILYKGYKEVLNKYTQFNKYDILGYVDSDIEKACNNAYINYEKEG